jgi:hypothetical protein
MMDNYYADLLFSNKKKRRGKRIKLACYNSCKNPFSMDDISHDGSHD